MKQIQGEFFEAAHSSMSASHSAAGKQRRQEENSVCENSLRREMVNENKAVQGDRGSKHRQSYVNTTGQHHLLCHTVDVSVLSKCIQCMHSALAYVSAGVVI